MEEIFLGRTSTIIIINDDEDDAQYRVKYHIFYPIICPTLLITHWLVRQCTSYTPPLQ